MTDRSKAGGRRARDAARVQLFVQRYGRRARSGGLDPNDRDYDRRVERAVRRMGPVQLDALLREGEDEEPL